MDLETQLKQGMMEQVYPDMPTVTSEENQDSMKMKPEEIMALPLYSLIDMEICGTIKSRQNSSENWRRPRRLKWDQAWQDYKQIYNSANKQAWQSTTYMPLITKSVEVIVSNMHGAVMGPQMPVEWEDRGRPDLAQMIGKHNKIISYDFEKCKFKAHWTDFLRTLVLCGTSIGMVDYAKEREEVMIKERRKPSIMDSILQKFGKQIELERFTPRNELVKDYARFKHVDLYDLYPQPFSEDFGKDFWAIRKGKITNKELIDGSMDPDPYYKLDNVTSLLLSGGGTEQDLLDPEKQVRRMAFLDYDIQGNFLDPDRPHELLEYYGPIPTWFIDPELRNDPQKKYDTVPGWIWVVDGQYVVRKRISPWRDAEPPFVKGNYIRIPNQFYGVGVGELLAGLQVEKNEIRNLNIDNINITMNKITAVLKDKVPQGEWKRLVSEPGALWVFQGVDDVRKAIQAIEFPDQSKSVWLSTQQIDQEAQEVSGAVKATLGVGGATDEAGGGTFRGQLMNKQVATERFMLYARVLEICGLGDAMKKFYQRIYQFKSYKEIDEILGPEQSKDFELIAPELMEKVAKLVPLGVLTLENKGLKLAQMRQFHEEWADTPFFKKLEMARKEWVEMGFPDPDSVLFSDQEMGQFNDFQKQLLGANQAIPSSDPTQMASPGSPQNPVAGGAPGPLEGLPREAMPPRGPGVSPVDGQGIPT